MEFNPILSGIGLHNFRQFRWFGGSAHNLPFADEQFDIVIANATLHHLVDIPLLISEMIRVLKPTGYLISMSDSFCNYNTSEDFESSIFNNNASVMMGINERIPRFDEFIKAFKDHQRSLEVKIFTHSCNNNINYPYEWQINDALKKLPHINGSISFVVRKKNSIKTGQPKPEEEFLHPSEYARCLGYQSAGVSRLTDYIPEQFLDLPLLDSRYPKFRLLNGWKMQVRGEDNRAAFFRSRLYFSVEKARLPYVSVSLLVPYISNYDIPTIRIIVNSEIVYMEKLIRGMWHNLTIPLTLKIKVKKGICY